MMDTTISETAKEKATYTDSPSPELFALQAKQMDLDSGWLGKVFGSSSSAPSNIAGLSLILMLAAGFVLLFWTGAAMAAGDYWKTIIPIVTLIFGYLFGKKT